jgi:hypothetical protein
VWVPQSVASLIAAVLGELFIQLTAVSLPPALVWPVRIVGALSFLAVLWYAVLRQRQAAPERYRRQRTALRTYYIWLALLILAIPAGIWLFTQVLPVPALIVPWLIVLVGLQFLPFASAFGIPLFERLGAVLMAAGVVGGAVVLNFSMSVSGLTGVVSGFILLVFAAAAAPAGTGGAATTESSAGGS